MPPPPPLLIENGRVVDPANGVDAPLSVLLADGRVVFVGDGTEARRRAGQGPEARRLDAAGCVVAPGFVDMHVHLREPGNEVEETIASGARAAVHGGFTSVACMPNTDPAIDSESAVTFVVREAKIAAKSQNTAYVFPVGSITVGRKGEELAEMAQMARGGAVAFTDDGRAVPSADLLRRALTYAKMLDKPVLEHCEDESLTRGGQMNAGALAVMLGLPGIPNASEELVVARDVILARLTGARLHIQHISTAEGVEQVRRAKAEGVRVTAEATPHHLTLTEECVRGYDPVFKVAPPLRTAADRDAVRRGLVDGTIDAIATDHAPHQAEEKEGEFGPAPCGMLGLETAVGVLLTELVHPGLLPWGRFVEALTARPAAILGLSKGTLSPGADADVTVIDPDLRWTVDREKFVSRSRNCPYHGRALRGRARWTIVRGAVAFEA